MSELIEIVGNTKTRTRVDVFCFNDRHEVLAISRTYSFPELPGGGVDVGESYIQASMRELQEEAGYIATDFKVIPTHQEYIFKGNSESNLTENSWDNERHVGVVCTSLGFKPDSRFGCEGDNDNYAFKSLESIVKETEEKLHLVNNRLKYLGMVRLKFIQILQQSKVPGYSNWQ